MKQLTTLGLRVERLGRMGTGVAEAAALVAAVAEEKSNKWDLRINYVKSLLLLLHLFHLLKNCD